MQAEGRVTFSISLASPASSRSALYTKSVPFPKFHRLAKILIIPSLSGFRVSKETIVNQNYSEFLLEKLFDKFRNLSQNIVGLAKRRS